MPGIVGTVITVKELYEQKPATISFGEGIEKKDLFCLKEDRKYIIPLFQREIRWQKGHLLTLISDVQKKPKFLGNVILTKTKEGNYEILDGQQRTTIIYLLIKYFEYKFSERFNVFSLCDLEVKSFSGLNKLLNAFFDIEKIPSDELIGIRASDDYEQYDKYLELWNEIDECAVFKLPADTEDFLKNLAKCTVNVIVSIEEEEEGIESFLDVNLKGVKLDTEDIFKGYLCSIDNSKDIHDVWSRLKKIDAKLNTQKQQIYPMMTVIEHYFRCKLPTNETYKDIEYNSEFRLVKEQEVEGKTYSQDTHLIAVIHNKSFLKECLLEIETVFELISKIKNSTGIADEYVKYINKYNENSSPKHKIQDKERDIMFNLTKKIILDKDKAPNCLLIKYFLEVFLKNNPSKEDFEKIYAVSTAALVFSLFETKKDLEKIKGIIKPQSWYEEMCGYVTNQLKSQASSSKTVKVAYKEKKDGTVDPQKFRCKTLATVFDFYEVNVNGINVKRDKITDLDIFLNDENVYSIEHFIINDSGKIDYLTSKGIHIEYMYPEKISKYRNSLLNYLFISENLNGRLGNEPVSVKCNRLTTGDLKKEFEKEKSSFSKMIVEEVQNAIKMPELDSVESLEDATNILDKYYQDSFEDDLLMFMKNVFERMRR